METIEIWRGPDATDADCNPVKGEPVRVGSFQAMVAPSEHDDPTDETGRPDTVTCTIYVRGDAPTGVLPTDLLMVRGELLHVSGRTLVWHDLRGRYVGDVIHLTERKG